MTRSENMEETTKPATEHLAMEILKQEREKSKAKNVGVVSLAVAIVVVSIGMATINYKNDCDWRRFFSEYDFISQDGEGINNVNGGEQGDITNGSASEVEKEQK